MTETEDERRARLDERAKPILDRIPTKWGKYLSIGEGWYDIVLKLDEQIAALYPDYQVYQCKEKFAGLRYYCSNDGAEDVRALIAAAEEECARTCDVCGKPGEYVNVTRYWVATRCPDDAGERDAGAQDA